jgi:hypothetical protein
MRPYIQKKGNHTFKGVLCERQRAATSSAGEVTAKLQIVLLNLGPASYEQL